jgi:hypothetical protein
MAVKEFFARLAPDFAQHESTTRSVVAYHADVKRLINTAEYECYQMRRVLLDVMPGIATEAAVEQGVELMHGLLVQAKVAPADAVQQASPQDAVQTTVQAPENADISREAEPDLAAAAAA